MIKELWINLPVKDVDLSKKFFLDIGFQFHPGPGNSDVSASFFIGSKNIVLMLFAESAFKNFTGKKITDTTKSNEVLFSFDAESKNEVDSIAKKVKKAGGTICSEPQENQGWMYGFSFADLDGHQWNVLFMDMSKMQKG